MQTHKMKEELKQIKMKKMLKKSDDLEKDLVNYFKKKRKSDPDYASKMDALDYI